MKIVVNNCYGGFGLSDKAYEKLISWGIPAVKYETQKRKSDGTFEKSKYNDEKVIYDDNLADNEKEKCSFGNRYWETWTMDYENRSHPLLVKVVEELGDAANGRHAELRIAEIPDAVSWEIDEYDGIETVHEQHRSW